MASFVIRQRQRWVLNAEVLTTGTVRTWGRHGWLTRGRLGGREGFPARGGEPWWIIERVPNYGKPSSAMSFDTLRDGGPLFRGLSCWAGRRLARRSRRGGHLDEMFGNQAGHVVVFREAERAIAQVEDCKRAGCGAVAKVQDTAG